jgi:hypothetical protein
MPSMYSGLLAAKENRRLRERQDRAEAQSSELASSQLQSESISQQGGLLGIQAKRAELDEMGRRAVERQKSEGFAELLADVETFGQPHPATLEKFNKTGNLKLKTARKTETGDIELEDVLGRKGVIPKDRIQQYQPYYKERLADDQKREATDRRDDIAEQRNLLDLRKEVATDLESLRKNKVAKRWLPGGPDDAAVAKYNEDVAAKEEELSRIDEALRKRMQSIDAIGMRGGGLLLQNTKNPLGIDLGQTK